MRVAILGASDRADRYAYKAFEMLREYGHEPVPVNPHLEAIEGVTVYPTLKDIPRPIDTLTMYVGPAISSKLIADIVALKPHRVIFNPGSENPELTRALTQAGIHYLNACTLVLLRTNQFAAA
jgi:uncharacterized protein